MNKSSNSSDKKTTTKKKTHWKAANILAECYTIQSLTKVTLPPPAENKNLIKIKTLDFRLDLLSCKNVLSLKLVNYLILFVFFYRVRLSNVSFL